MWTNEQPYLPCCRKTNIKWKLCLLIHLVIWVWLCKKHKYEFDNTELSFFFRLVIALIYCKFIQTKKIQQNYFLAVLTHVSVFVWTSLYCLDFYTSCYWIIPFVWEPHHPPTFIIYSFSQLFILCFLDLCFSVFFLLLFFPHGQTKWE